MNKFRNLAITALEMIILIVVVSAVIPTTVYGQGGTVIKDVNVVNTPTVNVANPVGLATGTTVGINPSNNTVKLDPNTPVVVQPDKTVLIFDKTFTIPPGPDGEPQPDIVTEAIDVRAFSKIRVIMSDYTTGDISVKPQINMDAPGCLYFPIYSSCPSAMF